MKYLHSRFIHCRLVIASAHLSVSVLESTNKERFLDLSEELDSALNQSRKQAAADEGKQELLAMSFS
jgi:hypothetical protein